MTKNFAVNLNSALETSSQEKIPSAKLLPFVQAIYIPYIPYITRYSIYETAQLARQLSSIECSHEDLSDTINSLSLSISKVLDFAGEANKRCRSFTEGCAYPGLLKSFNVSQIVVWVGRISQSEVSLSIDIYI